MMTIYKLPRNERTPETEVDVLLTNLSALYRELNPKEDKYYFINKVFKGFYEDARITGDKLSEALNDKRQSNDEGIAKATEREILCISLAYCCQAQKAWSNGEINAAWTFVIDSKEWCSRLMARHPGINRLLKTEHAAEVSRAMRENRKKGVDKYDHSDFIKKIYRSRAWKNKTEAVEIINIKLLEHIMKNGLPNRRLKSTNGAGAVIENEQSDYTKYIYKKLPSAGQVKIDSRRWLPTD